MRAPSLFRTMLGQQLTPDVIGYNSLVRACEKVEQPYRALSLTGAVWLEYRGMLSEWPALNVVAHSALISAC